MARKITVAAALAFVCAAGAALAQTMSAEERAALAAAETPAPIRGGLDGPWDIRVFGADGLRFDSLSIDTVGENRFTGTMTGRPVTDGVLSRGDAVIVLTWSTGRTYATDPGASSVQDNARRTHVARFRGRRIDGESMDESGAVAARWYALRPEDESDAPMRFADRRFDLRPIGARVGQCVDRYQFAGDGRLTVTSGREVLQTRWRVLPRRVGPMLVLERTLVSGNGEPDCSGDVSRASPGDVRRIYVMFRNDGSAAFCAAPFPEGAIVDCYANLVRVD
jgi:hypothetical protein